MARQIEKIQQIISGPPPAVSIERGNYSLQYEAMIDWFRERTWTSQSVIQGSLMVFGWMPTILEVHRRRESVITAALAGDVAAKLNAGEERSIAKNFINNSPVGTSKFLHFWRPGSFAIWDSNVCKALTGNCSSVRNLAAFEEYTLAIRECGKHYGKSLREIEQLIFWAGKNA